MKIFILEDEIHTGGYEKRQRLKQVLEGHDLVLAVSVEEGKKLFVPPYDLIILDHDMEGIYEHRDTHPNTGMRFIEWMVETWKPKHLPSIILHSVNDRNRRRMFDFLTPKGYHVVAMPFNDSYLKFMKDSFGLEKP